MGTDFLAEVRSAVIAGLGHDPGTLNPGKMRRFSTNGMRGDFAGWCIVFDDGQAAMYGCHRSGVRKLVRNEDTAALTRQQRYQQALATVRAVQQADKSRQHHWRQNEERNRRLLDTCRPIAQGDPAALYLDRRGFPETAEMPSVLRIHPALAYFHEGRKLGTFPALIAPLVAPDGQTVALHRTYVTPDGHKAGVPVVKKLTEASGPTKGASIPLFSAADGVIGIAEGIETALAAYRLFKVPTVAAYCANSLAEWDWPRCARKLVIFADNDQAGREAAAKLESRARATGLHVRVELPGAGGADWCDVWNAQGSRP